MSRRAVSLLVASIFVWSCAEEGGPSGSTAPVEETAVAQASATGASRTDAGDTPTHEDGGVIGADSMAGDPTWPAESDARVDTPDADLTEGDGAVDDVDAGEADQDARAEDDAGENPEEPVITGPGMPCAVKAVFYERCVGCHSEGGRAGVSVLTRATLIAESAAFPGQTIVERTVARMHDPEKPMPPRGERVADADIAAIEAWIADGMPATSCDL